MNSDLDIVFMIDNSGSMQQEQENIARNFPVFISALESLPEGLPNVHIGVVSSDLGAGKYSGANVEGCTSSAATAACSRRSPAAPARRCRSPKLPHINGTKQNFTGGIS